MPAPVALVGAVCHEVANHLAAARLSAYCLVRGDGPEEIAEASRAIDAVCAEARALLALVRPLLGELRDNEAWVSPRECLDAVVREVESLGRGEARLIVRCPPDVSRVRVDPVVLEALLLALVLRARQAASGRGRVRVSVSQAGRGVVFGVEGDGGQLPAADLRSPRLVRGRALILGIAAELLHRLGGRLALRPLRRGARIELVLPARRAQVRRPRTARSRRDRTPSPRAAGTGS